MWKSQILAWRSLFPIRKSKIPTRKWLFLGLQETLDTLDYPAPGDQIVTGGAMFLEVTSGATQNRPTKIAQDIDSGEFTQ